MKLLRYGPKGQEKPGLLDKDGRVRDLSGVIGDVAGAALLPESLVRLAAIDPATLPLVAGTPQAGLRLGPCVGAVGKFVCIGLNYADHAAESGLEVPKEPVIFNKWTSAISGPDDDVEIPRGSQKTDWEVELGVVIGKGGRYIPEAEALGHVAGYCVVNDVSEREYQIERGGTWDKGKGCDTFGPIGPWLVTPDEAGDIADLAMWLEVDGKRFQNGSTATMVFGVAHLISYCSRFMSFQPGDVISTGTPPGVGLGQKPPRYLKGGEVMRLGINGLGVQTRACLSVLWPQRFGVMTISTRRFWARPWTVRFDAIGWLSPRP
ncbi:MAG: ureidoglycolate lyase [Alphaproteobacteria bacterium HGW-Alphaproteobacteria-6]|nr:MAG: ureidoglycolate lyase [Alphaproteobacteria bacterium HGW-Alphaproteobacteria-6]